MTTTVETATVPQPARSIATPPGRTIWGLTPLQLHTRYWAAHGVQVVQQGEASQIVKNAELFLLTDPRSLALFKLTPLMDVLNWVKPQVLFVRVHDTRERGYRERVVTDEANRFVRFQRLYDASDSRLARVVLTPDREIAQLWQAAPDTLAAWRRLRKFIPRIERATSSVDGNVYDSTSDREIAYFLHDLLLAWRQPNSTIVRAGKAQGEVWSDPQAMIDANAKFIGPVWVGAGRHVDGATTVIGPAIVWDDPVARPATEGIQWLTIEPSEIPEQPLPRRDVNLFNRIFKRLFDLTFSILFIALTLWMYPFIALAIWIEDGRPFFFAHRRETLGGREFPCVKFRSMRKDAERIKEDLASKNQADGPQFFMDDDPRLTRVGRFIRKYHLDELPQFFNVLAGQMSIVGPRPSPFKENQYCPPWREARLSVRPGVTGLWQVKRTRRAGSDFQEWIKYDIEYVENRNWWLDLVIIWKTITMLLRRVSRS
ncbi:MAG TPA: sugar transferase [Tepidisphaeraceae bacterium]|jgi:lipopolysaccharide/colanic/teichoic acid biosynthesis glycosyltransferase